MDKASLLLVIIKRDMEKDYIKLLSQNDIPTVFSTPCKGTAGKSVLALLGLEKTERTLLLAVTTRTRAMRAIDDMVSMLGINLPGVGIAMGLPVGSIGGTRGKKYLMGEQNDQTGEVIKMDEKREFHYDLIVAIAQKDTSAQVMAAARTAGAGGGTIVHAKGTGAQVASQFLGVSIASEKEMILIVVRHEKKDEIMHAIMDKAGSRTEADAAVFSLPVESVAGLRSLMTADTEPRPGNA